MSAIAALRHRAHLGLLVAALMPSSDRTTKFNQWQGYARALRDIERGAGEKLAAKDAALHGYQLPRYLAPAAGALGEDVERLSIGEIHDRLTAAGIEVAPDALTGLDVVSAHHLEDGIVATVDEDGEHAAVRVVVDDGAGGHDLSVGRQGGAA
jgi:hypothetical protein